MVTLGAPRLEKFRVVTIEPLLFMYMFGSILSDATQQALIYHKVCLLHVNDSSICDDLKNESFLEVEEAVQADASHWFLYSALCFEIPSVLVAFAYGSLSDHFSRKLTLIVPIIGQVFATLNWIVNSMYLKGNIEYILIGPLISGCFGGWVTLLVGCMSYISDVSTDTNRTSRIAIAECFIALPIAISFFVSGIYLERTNYQTVFSTTLVLYILSILYPVVWLREPVGRKLKEANCRNVMSVVGPSAVKDAFSAVFRKREFNRRNQLIILFASMFLSMIAAEPTWILSYLYTKKEPLSWPQSMYGYYAGYFTTLRSLGLLLIGPVLKKRLGMRDTSIMILSLVTNAFGEAFMGFSKKTWMVFVSATISMFVGAKVTCQRAVMSTMVERNELGQMFAMFGSLQSVSMLAGSNIFNNLYPATLHFWSGFCFILGAVMAIFPLIMLIWLHIDLKKSEACIAMTKELEGKGIEDTASEEFKVNAKIKDAAATEEEEAQLLVDFMEEEEEEEDKKEEEEEPVWCDAIAIVS